MQYLIPFLIVFYLVLLGLELTIPEQWADFVKACLQFRHLRFFGFMPLSLGLSVLYSVYNFSFKISWLLLILSFIYISFGTMLLLKPKTIVSFYENYYFKRNDEEKKRMLKSDIVIMTTILVLLFIELL